MIWSPDAQVNGAVEFQAAPDEADEYNFQLFTEERLEDPA